MDYGKILKRAWDITWRWKILWILGFLAALGRGRNGNVDWSVSGDEGAWIERFMPAPAEIWGLLATVTCFAIILGIAIWVFSVIARGGLIAGVQQVEDEGSTSLSQAWRVGVSRFWTLFGVGILAAIPFLILIFLAIAVAVVAIVGGGVAFDKPGVAAAGILCGAPICCSAIILAIVLEQIRVYANRAAVLEGLGWLDAFARGWEVLKANVGSTIVLWIIFLVIGLILVFVIGGGLLGALAPFVALFANTEPGPWIAVPVCFGGLLAFIVLGLISAIVETFTSSTWTLAYREMTGVEAPTPPVE